MRRATKVLIGVLVVALILLAVIFVKTVVESSTTESYTQPLFTDQSERKVITENSMNQEQEADGDLKNKITSPTSPPQEEAVGEELQSIEDTLNELENLTIESGLGEWE